MMEPRFGAVTIILEQICGRIEAALYSSKCSHKYCIASHKTAIKLDSPAHQTRPSGSFAWPCNNKKDTVCAEANTRNAKQHSTVQ